MAPPSAGTLCRPMVLAGVTRIDPSSSQASPRGVRASASATDAPPSIDTFFSLPSAKKPIHRPSGEKNGPPADAVLEAASRFVGRRLQTPPAYSARKVEGERMYRLARKGKPATGAAVDASTAFAASPAAAVGASLLFGALSVAGVAATPAVAASVGRMAFASAAGAIVASASVTADASARDHAESHDRGRRVDATRRA